MTTLTLAKLLRNKYYTEADLTTRSNDAVFLKCSSAMAMIHVKGMTRQAIGDEIGVNHSTVSHYNRRVHPQMMGDKYYAACYLDACNLVRDSIEEQTSMTIGGLYKRLEQLRSEIEVVNKLIEELTSE